MKSRHCLILLAALFCDSSSAAIALRTDVPDPLRHWSFEAGVAFITHDIIDDVALGHTSVADGPSGGEIYLLTAAYKLREPEWKMGSQLFHPLLEIPLTFGVVDENGRSPFVNLSASFQVRHGAPPRTKRASVE